MSNPRITHLNSGIVTIGGVAYTHMFRTMNFNHQDNEQDGHTIGERYGLAVATKSKCTWGGSVFRTVAGVRQTMLDMSVFTIGGTSYLGKMRAGSLQMTTQLDMGEGGGDQWEFPHAVGTMYSINGQLQIATVSDFAALMRGSVAGRNVTVAGTLAGFNFNFPMKLSSSNHNLDVGRIEFEDIQLSNHGTPTSASGESSLLSCITGSASVTYSVDTGASVYSDNGDGAIITSARMVWASGQIIDDNFEFQTCGQPVIA